MNLKMHEYSHAIVGKLVTNEAFHKNFNEARHQYEHFLRLLKELDLEVKEVYLGEDFPKNILLEDIAIVCNGVALLNCSVENNDCKLKPLKDVLQNELGLTIIEVNDPNVKFNGSDVLFTGNEFFIGISDATNEAGAALIAETFPEFPCTPIKASDKGQHLKKFVSVAGPNLLCISSSKEAQDIVKRMEREASFSYHTITVPEDAAANCLHINGTLIHRAIEEIPESFKVFCERIDYSRRSICFSELAEIATGLSSYCLLVKKYI